MLLAVVLLVFVADTASAAVDAVRKPAARLPFYSSCCWPKPRNCAELYRSGVRTNGVYQIYPLLEDHPAAVFCDMTTDGGGWTVIQKRFNGEVDFYRGWNDYKKGFGSVFREYWWGNDKLHQVTSQEPQQLRVDISDFDNASRYAKYSNFGVADAAGYYRASVGGYSGNAGDSLAFINGQRFSTKDIDHDTYSGSCAQAYKGGSWYAACHSSNLNGLYLHGTTTVYAQGMCWNAWRGYHYSLKTSDIKIRPANF
ncbi:Ryncolin-1 [Lamellibrachia satsuma]|nr:Ryncolin-1 [Lamellibrachia satsuma]